MNENINQRYSSKSELSVPGVMTKRLFIDIDGTLARFHDDIVDETGHVQIEKMYEPGFFERLKPFNEMVDAVKDLLNYHEELEVFVLSSAEYGNPPGIIQQKNKWLDQYLPEIDRNHRIYPEITKKKIEFIPRRNTELDYQERMIAVQKICADAAENGICLPVNEDGTLTLWYVIDRRFLDKTIQDGIPKGSLLDPAIKNKEFYDEHGYAAMHMDFDPRGLSFDKDRNKIMTDNLLLYNGFSWSSVPRISEDDYLLDDYNKNLREFAEAGGQSIKCINNINHFGLGRFGGDKGNLWDGNKVQYDHSSMKIAKDLLDLMSIDYNSKLYESDMILDASKQNEDCIGDIVVAHPGLNKSWVKYEDGNDGEPNYYRDVFTDGKLAYCYGEECRIEDFDIKNKTVTLSNENINAETDKFTIPYIQFLEDFRMDDFNLVQKLVSDLCCAPEILEVLSSSENWETRIKVAMNPNTPGYVLEKLVNDVDELVSREAKEQLGHVSLENKIKECTELSDKKTDLHDSSLRNPKKKVPSK